MPRCGLGASTTRLTQLALNPDTTDHLSPSSQPLIYCEQMDSIRANKFQRAKKKGKELLSSFKQAFSCSRSPSPSNRTLQPDPPSASGPIPTRPAHNALPSARSSGEVGMLSSHQSEDLKGVSETPKQIDHPAITAADLQLVPHAVSVFWLWAFFCSYIRALIVLISGYSSLYRCSTTRGQPGRRQYWTGAISYAKGFVCGQGRCLWIANGARGDKRSVGCTTSTERRGIRDSGGLGSL